MQIDFGSTPTYSKQFTIGAASVTPSSVIVAIASAISASGRTGDDSAWDSLTLTTTPGTGSFTLTAFPTPGPVVGARTIHYQIS